MEDVTPRQSPPKPKVHNIIAPEFIVPDVSLMANSVNNSILWNPGMINPIKLPKVAPNLYSPTSAKPNPLQENNIHLPLRESPTNYNPKHYSSPKGSLPSNGTENDNLYKIPYIQPECKAVISAQNFSKQDKENVSDCRHFQTLPPTNHNVQTTVPMMKDNNDTQQTFTSTISQNELLLHKIMSQNQQIIHLQNIIAKMVDREEKRSYPDIRAEDKRIYPEVKAASPITNIAIKPKSKRNDAIDYKHQFLRKEMGRDASKRLDTFHDPSVKFINNKELEPKSNKDILQDGYPYYQEEDNCVPTWIKEVRMVAGNLQHVNENVQHEITGPEKYQDELYVCTYRAELHDRMPSMQRRNIQDRSTNQNALKVIPELDYTDADLAAIARDSPVSCMPSYDQTSQMNSKMMYSQATLSFLNRHGL